jgi:predicted acyltransferase
MAGAYIAYAIAAFLVFWSRPALQVALICSFGGWLFLPVAAYPAATITTQGFTMEVIGSLLPSNLPRSQETGSQPGEGKASPVPIPPVEAVDGR